MSKSSMPRKSMVAETATIERTLLTERMLRNVSTDESALTELCKIAKQLPSKNGERDGS